ncbi:H-NS histone family protein [Vibrio parahaemolyticus]|nr:H-NS histone family protein [Vibrio parahaemolyticus]
MSIEIAKTLLNVRSLRSATSNLTVNELIDCLGKLETVVAERQEQEAELLKAQAEKNERIESILSTMAQHDIKLSDLEFAHGNKSTSTKKRAKRPAKYSYQDENGQEKTWTGQGRTPSIIQAGLDSGKSLEDYAI